MQKFFGRLGPLGRAIGTRTRSGRRNFGGLRRGLGGFGGSAWIGSAGWRLGGRGWGSGFGWALCGWVVGG